MLYVELLLEPTKPKATTMIPFLVKTAECPNRDADGIEELLDRVPDVISREESCSVMIRNAGVLIVEPIEPPRIYVWVPLDTAECPDREVIVVLLAPAERYDQLLELTLYWANWDMPTQLAVALEETASPPTSMNSPAPAEVNDISASATGGLGLLDVVQFIVLESI